MRNLFVLLLCGTVGLGFLASGAAAQPTKKPEDPEKVLADLLVKVKDKATDKVQVRIDAIMALAEFGPKAEPALPDLLDALQDKNEDLRLNAAIALGKLGKPAVKEVARLLNSPDENTKFYAIWTLGWIGPEAKVVVPTMIQLLADKNEGVRRKAAFALGRLAGDPDKTIAALVSAFKDESDEVRQEAGTALSKFGKVAVPALIELLKQENPKARLQASTSLGAIGSEAKDAVPALKELFLEKQTANANPYHYHYAQVLAKIGGKESVAALEAGFKDGRPDVRQAAVQSLQQIGADAVPVLIDGLGAKDVDIRRLAAITLAQMRIGDKSVVIALAFAMAADEDDTVRQWCMNGLQQLGPQAKLAAPKLKEALSDMNPGIRNQAFQLLQTIGENPGPTLVKALASKNEKVRINTACLMVTMNIETGAATPVLIDALDNKDLGLKMQAASTLAQRQLQKDKVLPIFLEGLKHKSSGVRVQAVQGVGSFGAGAASAAPDIARMFNDPDAGVAQTAVNSMHQVRGDAATVLPILTAILKDGKPESRRMVMQVLQIYGEKSLGLLTDGLKDSDANVRQHAIWAMHQQNFRSIPDKVVPVLTKAYKDGDANTKRTILQVAYLYGGKVKDIVLDGLKDKDAGVRQQAVFALQNLQGDISEAIPAIVSLMKEKNSGIDRNQLGWILSRGGEAGAIALGDIVKDGDANTRLTALQQLRNMGGNAVKALPAMQIAVKDENTQVRMWAVLAMMNVGGDGPKFAIKHYQDEKDGGVRASMLQNLANHGHQKLLLPLLKPAMKDPAAQVRQTAINLIGHFGQKSDEGFEVFKIGLQDSDNQVRINAANHGNFFGQKCWSLLEDSLKSTKDSGFREAILNGLHNSGYRSKASIPTLIECLKDDNQNVRANACHILGNIGPDAADALPMMRKVAADGKNPFPQNAARNAIARIEVKKSTDQK